jgi:hypothetical protein
MKKMMAIALVAGMAVAARADISINWRGQTGFYDNGQFLVDPTGGILNDGNSGLALLIWTPTAVIDPVDPSNGGNGYVSGDDIFLDSVTILAPGNDYGAFANTEAYTDAAYAAQLGTNLLANGFVYFRVFSDTTPANGEYYYDSGTLDATPYTGLEAPQDLDQSNLAQGNELNVQIVPEPTTIAFMGIGSLLVALRRRAQKS